MEKISKILVIILIIEFVMAYINMSLATDKKQLQEEQSNLTNSISQSQEELQNIEKEKSETLSQVEELMSQISDYETEIDELDSKISELQTQIEDAEMKIKEDEEEYERQQKALNERLVAIYENGDISYLDVLLSSSSLTDFISSYYIVSELTNYDSEMLKLVEEEKQKIENEKQQLENDKEELDTAKKAKETKSEALKVVKNEKEEKAEELSEEEKQTQKEIEEMLQDKAEIEKELQKIAQQEAIAAEAARKAKEEANKNKNTSSSSSNTSSSGSNTSSTSQISSTSSSGYIFPVAGCSKANIRNLVYPSYAGHTGVDINIGVVGKSVVAVQDGTVATSAALKNSDGSYRSYGEYIIITHSDGTATLYAHMLAGSRKVTQGDKVKQGQVIGIVGSTGNSTGTHLHFEVRILTNSNGSYSYKIVNPIPYLP